MRLSASTLRLGVALTSLLALLGLGSAPASADNNAIVTISDTGFSPQVLTITVGATVFFTNGGTKVHTATTRQIGGTTPFDTGGISPNQTVSINFTLAGAYPYTSNTDCVNGGGSQTGFDCSVTATIVVNYAGGAPIVGSLTPLPTPSPTPVLSGPPQNVLVHITNKGFDPPTVTVALGGEVTFENDDNGGVHTATTTGGGNPTLFDTGGLSPGLQANFGFTIQGTYTYTSAVDCLSSKNPNFNCGTYQVIVSGQPSGLAPSPAAAPVAPVGTLTQVTLSENGFTPTTLAVHPGQTVTWTNTGTRVHTVVADPGYADAFDSGGLAPGQTFSHVFQSGGSYGYHSTTEVNYAIDPFGRTVQQWQLVGTVLVQ